MDKDFMDVEDYDFSENIENFDSYNLMVKSALAFDLLTPEEETELGYRKMNGDEQAREKLINHNQRLALSIASRFKNDHLTKADILQEALKGLIVGVDKFDPEQGRLSTIATQWIRQAIRRSIDENGRTIRKPGNVCELESQIKKTFHKLTQTYGREPTKAEVAKILGTTEARIEEALMPEPTSMDVPIRTSVEEPVYLSDVIKDDPFDAPEDSYMRKDMKENLEKVLDTLSPKEKQVMSLRFGLDGNGQRSLEEVGTEMGFSREWVRQLEKRAFLKLRNPVRAKIIKGYLTD